MKQVHVNPDINKREALKQMATDAHKNLRGLTNEDRAVATIVVVVRSLKRFGRITPEVRNLVDEYTRLNPEGKAGIEAYIASFPDATT